MNATNKIESNKVLNGNQNNKIKLENKKKSNEIFLENCLLLNLPFVWYCLLYYSVENRTINIYSDLVNSKWVSMPLAKVYKWLTDVCITCNCVRVFLHSVSIFSLCIVFRDESKENRETETILWMLREKKTKKCVYRIWYSCKMTILTTKRH